MEKPTDGDALAVPDGPMNQDTLITIQDVSPSIWSSIRQVTYVWFFPYLWFCPNGFSKDRFLTRPYVASKLPDWWSRSNLIPDQIIYLMLSLNLSSYVMFCFQTWSLFCFPRERRSSLPLSFSKAFACTSLSFICVSNSSIYLQSSCWVFLLVCNIQQPKGVYIGVSYPI